MASYSNPEVTAAMTRDAEMLLPVAQRIDACARRLAGETGARHFAARLGTPEWEALVQQMKYSWGKDTPDSVKCLRFNTPVGVVECVLDPKCDDIIVSSDQCAGLVGDGSRSCILELGHIGRCQHVGGA